MGVAGAGLAIVGAGAVVSTVSAVSSAEAQGAQAKYQSQVAANNATIAQNNAQMAVAAGESQAQQEELKDRGKAGAIKAAAGANGITLGSGSAGDVDQSERLLNETDAATIRSNAARSAYGYETQASNFTASSALESSIAGQADTNAILGGTGSLLGSAASGAGKYSSWVQAGGGSGASAGF